MPFFNVKGANDGVCRFIDVTVPVTYTQDKASLPLENVEIELKGGGGGKFTGRFSEAANGPNGEGRMVFNNERVYEGNFAGGAMDGRGKLTGGRVK